jgi:hypothetical protein
LLAGAGDDDKAALRGELYRFEAARAIAEYNLSAEVRKAILRKTAKLPMDDLVAVEKVV